MSRVVPLDCERGTVAISTGFVCHPDYLNHDTGPGHVESPDRLRAILKRLRDSGLADKLVEITARPAEIEDILQVHTEKYVDIVRGVSARGGGPLDPDTMLCDQSYDVAILAAGGVISACDAVLDGTVDNAFCAVRPPGHHALRFKAMGFCIFNNVAIAARYLREKRGIERVAIVDWDVHHGNGTQDAFYSDPTVFYASIHQSPHYPGSGHDWETGKNEAEGTILNIPVPPGTTNDEFVGAVSSKIVPAVREFAPEFLLISAGFDAHESDMLSSQHVSIRGYADMTKLLMDCARECCDGRLVSVLEGGYNPSSLADAVEAHVRTLLRI